MNIYLNIKSKFDALEKQRTSNITGSFKHISYQEGRYQKFNDILQKTMINQADRIQGIESINEEPYHSDSSHHNDFESDLMESESLSDNSVSQYRDPVSKVKQNPTVRLNSVNDRSSSKSILKVKTYRKFYVKKNHFSESKYSKFCRKHIA